MTPYFLELIRECFDGFYPLSFGSTPTCANEAAAAIAALVTAGKISPPKGQDEMDDSSDKDIGGEVADSTDGACSRQ